MMLRLRASATLAIVYAAALLSCDASRDVSETADSPAAIVGGTVSTPGARPWQVHISADPAGILCGGALIAPDWVLAAAHCYVPFSHQLLQTDYSVVAGDHDLTVAEGFEQTRRVDRIVPHPSYGAGGSSPPNNDIALFHLSAPMTFNARVSPIRLAANNDGPGQNAVVSGWGLTSGTGSGSNVLLEATIPIVPSSDCAAMSPWLLPRSPDARELCAGTITNERGSCRGDSGGPLAVNRGGGIWDLVGVVSFGSSNCETYGVYSRVSSHLAWIKEYVIDPETLAAVLALL